jgi:hypothetical protein
MILFFLVAVVLLRLLPFVVVFLVALVIGFEKDKNEDEETKDFIVIFRVILSLFFFFFFFDLSLSLHSLSLSRFSVVCVRLDLWF